MLLRRAEFLRSDARGFLFHGAFFAGFLQVATLSLSNYSAQYLNIPTQMLFKSSKLIPVMAVNEIYFRCV
jgi:hypothetical protein